MAERKLTRQFTFTVEGETEQWYLLWLRDQINACPSSKYNVSIVPKVEQDPMKFAKQNKSITATVVTHICDYESNDEGHKKHFEQVLDCLKSANSIKGCKLKFKLGYSNFTFELWMILHKRDCNGELAHRKQYLSQINRAFDETFENLDHYKREDNFKRCLSKLTLDDVRSAINRAKAIMKSNVDNGKVMHEYKGFTYYTDNPALTIWESIEQILLECGLM